MNAVKIALTGKMRSGKNTVADYLEKEYGFVQFAFADSLKLIVTQLFGLDEEDGIQYRKLLQKFGQYCRSIDPDVWIRQCFEDMMQYEFYYETCDGKKMPIVITDLRQPNEYDRCRAEGFVIVRVTAPDELRIERIKQMGEEYDDETLNHETEQYVDTFDVDYEIRNDSDLDSLYAQVDAIMHDLGVQKTSLVD